MILSFIYTTVLSKYRKSSDKYYLLNVLSKIIEFITFLLMIKNPPFHTPISLICDDATH
jgi:hypothetical protein